MRKTVLVNATKAIESIVKDAASSLEYQIKHSTSNKVVYCYSTTLEKELGLKAIQVIKQALVKKGYRVSTNFTTGDYGSNGLHFKVKI